MKKIYLAGASGQLGSYLKKDFKNKKYKLLIKKIDLTKKNTIEILDKLKPDIIINCAGYTSIEKCEKYKKLALKLNALIPQNLSKYAVFFNKYLIHISTDHLYDSKIKKKSLEKEVAIKNFYAKSKFIGEQRAQNKNTLILRTNFFGNSLEKKGLISWIFESEKKKKEIILYKNIYFSPLHISTLSKIILKIISKKISGIYNVGSKNGMSKADFIKKLIRFKKLKIKYKIKNYKNTLIKRPKNMLMNVRKFEKRFKIILPQLKNEIKKIK